MSPFSLSSPLRSAYGPDPNQFGDLRLPAGPGPHPVLLSIHGGFWRAKYGLEYNERLSAWFADRGCATWNIEYRRVGQEGGGYPGTLLDAAAAADHLRTLAERYPLDLARVVAVGHSAGGQLALWLAGRRRLPGGPLRGSGDPLPLSGVISLAGVADLEAMFQIHEARAVPLEESPVPGVLGGVPTAVPERVASASPARLAPLGVHTVLIHGADDQIVPVSVAESYARVAGPEAELIVLDRVEHFQVIDPDSEAWAPIAAAVDRLLGRSG